MVIKKLRGKRLSWLPIVFAVSMSWAALGGAISLRPSHQDQWNYTFDFYSARLENDPVDFIAMNHLADAYVTRARTLGNDTDYLNAEEMLRRSLAVNNSRYNLSARSRLAPVLLSQHRFREGLAEAESVLELKPDDATALAAAGDARSEMGDLKGAVYEFRQLLRIAPGMAAYSRMALLEQALGRASESHAWFLMARDDADQIGGEPAAWVRVMMADLAIKTGDYDTARNLCREALQIMPAYYLAFEHQAEIEERTHDYASARPLLYKAVAIARQPELLLRLANVEEQLNNPSDAERLRTEALLMLEAKIVSGNQGHLRSLANGLLDLRKDMPRALFLAEQDALLRGGYLVDATLARALAANGAMQRARVYMNRALQHNPIDPNLYRDAAQLFADAGDHEASAAALEAAGRFMHNQH